MDALLNNYKLKTITGMAEDNLSQPVGFGMREYNFRFK